MSHRIAAAVAATAITAAGLVAAPAADAATCSTPWGSLTKSSSADSDLGVLTNVRAGQHPCFDRLVFDVSGPLSAYLVQYVPVVRDDADVPHPVAGAADLQVVLRTPAYNEQGRPTYNPRDSRHAVPVGGFRTLRQVDFVSTFEGYSEFAVGVRARLPMRVFTLHGPGGGSRVVVDIAHRWY